MFLATVVETQGSTYRKPGARMLMTQSGQMIGAISGGCLENDVYEQTQQRMGSKSAIAVTYDTTADEDVIWGFGIGCNGVVQVLIERIDSAAQHQIDFLRHCLQHGGVMATVVQATTIPIGSRLMLNGRGQVTTNIQNFNLLSFLTQEAYLALNQQQSVVKHYHSSAGSVKAFIEVIQPPPSLIVFGAGRDALPVVQFAKILGWAVTVMDFRSSEATSERFAIADHVILTRRESFTNQISINTSTLVIVMTHNYLDDVEILKELLRSPARYIGVLGSKQRTDRFVRDLQLTQTQLDQFYSPIGLDIGTETPTEIALSIVAEIQAVLNHRKRGSLKHRTGAIHNPATRWTDHSSRWSIHTDGNLKTTITPRS